MKALVHRIAALKSNFFQPLFPALVILLFSLSPSHVAAQANTVWSLNANIRDGIASARSYYPTEFTVLQADSAGGYVQARAIKPGEPNCYAVFDYRWTFSSPLDIVRQGDILEVKIELSANPGPQCPPPLDPLMSLGPVEGRLVNTDLVGTFTQAERALILWHPGAPSSNGRIDVPVGHPTGDVADVFQLMVDDTRTSSGNNQNAERGAFVLSLGYRGNVYEIYYIVSAQ